MHTQDIYKPLPVSLKIREPTVMAAAVSPARSDPGAEVVILNDGLNMVIFSGLPQYAWSTSPSATFTEMYNAEYLIGQFK